MNGEVEALELWGRALKSYEYAKLGIELTPDDSAGRAYYAAFHAVSALLALDGVELKKHSAVESAVHNSLVRSGRWTPDLGRAYSSLRQMRAIGDYGVARHLNQDEAYLALDKAKVIIDAVRAERPDLFT